MNIRWTLIISYLLVLSVAVLTLGGYLNREMGRLYLGALESRLFSQAAVIEESTAQDFTGPQAQEKLDDAAIKLGEKGGFRITYISPDGTVLGDTEQDPQKMANHLDRPEIREALRLGRGRSARYSQTLGKEMLYIAVAAEDKGKSVGVVRIAMPLTEVDIALKRIRSIVIGASLPAFGLALLLGFVLSHRVVKALRKLNKAAGRLAEGDFDVRVRLKGSTEMVELAGVFNETAARLRTIVKQLRDEKQKAATILQGLGEAILVTDATGHIELCNRTAEKLFDIDCATAKGLGVVDATQSPPLEATFRQALETGKTQETEIQLLFPLPRILKTTVTPLTESDRGGAVAIFYDVTELRRLEGIRREFVANASHELQTPITAIKAMTEALLAGGRQDAELEARFLKDLEKQADRLGALVRDLFDLTTIESAELSLRIERVNVAESVQRALVEVSSAAAQRKIELKSDVPEELAVRVDRSALHRVLINLLDNAVKYTEAGGEVGIRADEEDGKTAVIVWDTGIGIPSTDLPHIFERFYRVDKARSREMGGTGLGLSIVKHLVEALGGEIRVNSVLGKGSEFIVVVPTSDITDK